jgi:hypothetical protein
MRNFLKFLLPEKKDQIEVNTVFDNSFHMSFDTVDYKFPRKMNNQQIVKQILKDFEHRGARYVSTIYRNDKLIYDFWKS